MSRSENTCSGHVHLLHFVVIAAIIIVFSRFLFSILSICSSVLVFFLRIRWSSWDLQQARGCLQTGKYIYMRTRMINSFTYYYFAHKSHFFCHVVKFPRRPRSEYLQENAYTRPFFLFPLFIIVFILFLF